jgi:hypothetical protein
MKRFSLYGLVLLTALVIIFFSMRFVSSKDVSNNCSAKDTIQQGSSNNEVTPNSSDNKCGKCCCTKSCDKTKCSKEKIDEEVQIGKNPNLNNPDTVKNKITPQEDKK